MKKYLLLFVLIQFVFGISYNEEFQVNTYTAGLQSSPQIASLSNGIYVICWISYAQDGSGNGIYAQIFSETGEKIGDEFRVNTITEGDQCYQNIVSLSNNTFVICWLSHHQNVNEDLINAQIFSDTGEKIGREFQVNTNTDYYHYIDYIYLLSNGNFIIYWVCNGQDGSKDGIYAQIFSETGEKIGDEFQVNTYTENDQFYPNGISLCNGKFVICWNSDGQDGSGYGIYAQFFSETGEKIGNEFKVNTYTKNNQQSYLTYANLGLLSNIILLADGTFAIFWNSEYQDGSDYGIYAQIFSETGEKIGDEFRVNTYTTYHQAGPKAVSLLNSKFAVCWSSLGQDGPPEYGTGYGIYAKYYLSEPILHELDSFNLISPLTDETVYNIFPTFLWQSPSRIRENFPWEISYDLYISEDSEFTDSLIYNEIFDTCFTITDTLKKDQNYFWKVMARNWEYDSLWSSNVNGFYVSPDAVVGVEKEDKVNLSDFKLHQNYPNPFNPVTNISYNLPAGTDHYKVVIKIYDLRGLLVQILENCEKSPSSYTVQWNATDLQGNKVSNGLYIYTIQAGEYRATEKMLLLK